MSNLARKAWLMASTLLLCAAGSCHVGDLQYQEETERLQQWMEANKFYSAHLTPDTNIWEPLGGVLFLVGVSVAAAAWMLRGRDAE